MVDHTGQFRVGVAHEEMITKRFIPGSQIVQLAIEARAV
jgi:hypothetical protein